MGRRGGSLSSRPFTVGGIDDSPWPSAILSRAVGEREVTRYNAVSHDERYRTHTTLSRIRGSTTLDFSQVLTSITLSRIRWTQHWTSQKSLRWTLAAGDRQGCSPPDCCLVAYLSVGLLGLSHTRFSEGLLPSGGDLQSCVSGDDAVLDAWLGVERQTGALEEAEGDRGAPNPGVVLTFRCYGGRGGRNSKGFLASFGLSGSNFYSQPFAHIPPYSLRHRKLAWCGQLTIQGL